MRKWSAARTAVAAALVVIAVAKSFLTQARAANPPIKKTAPIEAEASRAENDCKANYAPEAVVSAYATDESVRHAVTAAPPEFYWYYICLALAARNPDNCGSLQVIPASSDEPSRDISCKSAYYQAFSILEVLKGTGNGLASCLQSVINATDPPQGAKQICRDLVSGYPAGSSRSVCSRFVSKYQVSSAKCKGMMAYLDGNPAKCSASPRSEREVCRMEAALLKTLRTKDSKTCEGVPMCQAAMIGNPRSCEWYAKKATEAFCRDWVDLTVKAGHYSPQEMQKKKNAPEPKPRADQNQNP